MTGNIIDTPELKAIKFDGTNGDEVVDFLGLDGGAWSLSEFTFRDLEIKKGCWVVLEDDGTITNKRWFDPFVTGLKGYEIEI